MKKVTRKAFTLIELLVVITIIGILATGAVSVYTGQIQKARDTTRINDVEALKMSIEQVYQDDGEYPHSDKFVESILTYMKKLPKDSKHAQPCNDGGNNADQPDCGYIYNISTDDNGIAYGDFEVSTAFENEANVTKKAAKDGGDGNVRLEIGNDLTNDTNVSKDAITGTNKGACTLAGAKASNGTTKIYIAGNPNNASNECD